MIHGIAEHSGRYEQVGAQSRGRGNRGHRHRPAGPRNHRRPKGHVETFDGFLDDVEDQITQMRPFGVPVILLGHSMGGLVSTSYGISDRAAPDLLVLSGPALGTDLPGWQITAVSKLAQLSPKLFVGPPFDTEVLSRDPEVGKAYNADPLVKPGGSANLLAHLMSTMASTAARLTSLQSPRCVCTAATMSWCRRPLRSARGPTRRERRVLPNLRHEIFNEPEGATLLRR